ncbi:unnamed protein product [Miscanthus lutarioriparius]|uniref:Peptidase C14 caspase domain-containing protein n=1 Tax=Miscanthus lutarioriparius TaxID=422564 RepID=A0A811SAI6_9POAL|nr:unnamed protein product [Miscanthus lutarioriparius]
MEAAGAKKKMLATLVGCNYAGTEYELQGCINDVHAMRAVLLDRFGFAPGDVTVLTDDDRGGGVLPTGAGVRRALSDMVARAAPGDVLFFHFSGHGTLVPPVSGRPRRGHGGRDDEAIVPCDFNLITDVDFRELVDRVPRGATFTMVSDSCHSGGLIDQEKEQIVPTAAADPDLHAHAIHAGRFLPYAAVLGHLSGASGVGASHHVADHLLALFGADASAKFLHRRNHDGNSSGAARPDDAGILLSGCQTDETSVDVAGDDDAAIDSRACGAFSAALQAVLAAHPAPMSNREVVRRAREVLGEQGFQQHPCLYCSDANADAPFLGQQDTKAKSN